MKVMVHIMKVNELLKVIENGTNFSIYNSSTNSTLINNATTPHYLILEYILNSDIIAINTSCDSCDIELVI